VISAREYEAEVGRLQALLTEAVRERDRLAALVAEAERDRDGAMEMLARYRRILGPDGRGGAA
jgi:hypothetical protein